MAKILFLHGGPGLNAGVERAWFGDTLPVEWWDQPSVPEGTAQPFEYLVRAAENKLNELTSHGSQVGLLAHSFGGQIATELAHRHPQLISHITLLGCPPDLIDGLLNLGYNLAANQIATDRLPTALGLLYDHLDNQTLRGFLEVLLSIPGLLDYYWSPGSQMLKERFNHHAAKSLRFDIPTFFATTLQIMGKKCTSGPIAYTGPVRLLMGIYDSQLQIERDEALWKLAFPQLSFETTGTGHFIHFELPIKEWL